MIDLTPFLAGAAFGLLGQSINLSVGLLKRYVDPSPPPWSWGRFLLTMWLGAAAGVIASMFGNDVRFLTAAGYAGVSAIDGLMTSAFKRVST